METSEIVNVGVNILCHALNEELRVLLQKKKSRKRRVWVKPWINRRQNLGASNILLKELACEDPSAYRNHLRMSKDMFESLLEMVTPYLTKQDTIMRQALSVKLKLEITLRYLATGDNFSSLMYLYRVPKSTISQFLPSVCTAIYEALKPFIMALESEEKWKSIQRGFQQRWNFPNCCGAIDGKHVIIRNPAHSGSNFYNYKGTYSIILLAVVDADYCFSYIDVERNGRMNDSAVFRELTFNIELQSKTLHLPSDAIFVADDAFPLTSNILKPYSRCGRLSKQQKVFNYRLSRARRIVENAFGILASHFRVFLSPVALQPEKVEKHVMAACTLHNWLKKSTVYLQQSSVDSEDFESGQIIPGEWRTFQNSGLMPLSNNISSNNYSREAAQVRENYAHYFMEEGAVPWQDKMIF